MKNSMLFSAGCMAFMFMAMACVPQVLATGEIQVTYPNGGESIDASIGRIDVRWESSLTGEVDIYLSLIHI